MKVESMSRVRRFATTYLCLLAALVLCCQGPQPVHAQPLPDRRTLRGVVTSADGRPIGDAAITLRRQDENASAQFWGAYAVTDARGAFTVPDMEEGAYYVDVTADGYAPDNSHNFTLGPASQSLQIKLVHLVPLTLRVLKPDGKPLTNTAVMLRISGGAGTRLPQAVTDDKGRIKFELANNDMPNCPLCQLMPSHYGINIIVPGVGFAIIKDLAVQSAQSPGTVDVRLQVGGGVRVTAHEGATGTTGQLIGGALLSLTPVVPDEDAAQRGVVKIPEDIARAYTIQRDPSGASLVTRDGDGTVELSDLPPGPYKARVFAPGQDMPEPQDVTLKAGETTQVDFNIKPLDPVGSLAVTARDTKDQAMAGLDFVIQLQPLANGAGASDAAVTPPPLPPGAPVGAINMFYSGFLRRAHSDANGHFTLYPIKPGKYRMRVAWPYVVTQTPLAQRHFERRVTPYMVDITVPATGGITAVTLKFAGNASGAE